MRFIAHLSLLFFNNNKKKSRQKLFSYLYNSFHNPDRLIIYYLLENRKAFTGFVTQLSNRILIRKDAVNVMRSENENAPTFAAIGSKL